MNALAVVPPQQEQREHAVINSVGIHGHRVTGRAQQKKRRVHCRPAILVWFESRPQYRESGHLINDGAKR
jgi:hypothetical protein